MRYFFEPIGDSPQYVAYALKLYRQTKRLSSAIFVITGITPIAKALPIYHIMHLLIPTIPNNSIAALFVKMKCC